MRNKIIVVLGMHRSGTSLVTGTLQAMGVSIGEKLYPAGPDNPTGFWEDEDCLKINEELLALLGSAYDQLDFAWEPLPQIVGMTELHKQAVEVVRQRLRENGGCWGFKDPRTCRLLSFWRGVFAECDCDLSYIITLRNPMSIVRSLERRNNLPAEKSYVLWLQHALPAVLQTQDAHRIVIDYDALLTNPREQLDRLASFLDAERSPEKQAQRRSAAEGLMDASLRHADYSLDDLISDPRAPGIVVRVYVLLRSFATGERDISSSEATGAFAELVGQITDMKPIISYAGLVERDQRALWQKLEDAGGRSDRAKQTIDDLEVRLSQQTQTIAALEDNFEARLSEQKQLIAALEQGWSDARRELQQVLTSHSWTVTKPLRFLRRVMTKGVGGLAPKLEAPLFSLWHKLPGLPEKKTRLKHQLFTRAPLLFGWSRAYRTWSRMNGVYSQMPGASPFASTSQSADGLAEGCYVPLARVAPPSELKARAIALYLPQFHPIEQNDAWWGEGFTEWTNVRPAEPQFPGHYQPHVPGELGYYDLLDDQVFRRQIELAKTYGISGFCFYYYWFAGTRLLEQPLERYLVDSSLEFPFCLCWANENWSRRWDGKESELLIAQEHSPEDDIRVAADLARYLKDERYIRINGKPLIVVYRPSLLPSARRTSERWRQWFRDNGIGEVYLVYTQSFEVQNPEVYGFDAAIEFPPNNSAPPNITETIEDSREDFQGTVYDWSVFAQRSENYKNPGYKIYRSVCPSWDNTARRKNRGTIFLNSNPRAYQRWLENAVEDTCRNAATADERLVFINAWNEWAEGAHLEPDEKYGYAWLEATRKALTGEADRPLRNRIAIVSHDAHPHGAQFLALGLVRAFAEDLKFEVEAVLLGDGRLTPDFERLCTVNKLIGLSDYEARATQLAKNLYDKGIRHALVNTTASGHFVEYLTSVGIKCLCLIHELPGVIESHDLKRHAQAIALHADKIVFPAVPVSEGFKAFASVDPDKQVIRPQGLYRRNSYRLQKEAVRESIRAELDIKANGPMVLTVGYGDHRKGADIFARIGLKVLERWPDAVFVWVGHWDEKVRAEVASIVGDKAGSFRFTGYNPSTARYHVAADVYALTSREDPFPNVVLESFDAGVPVVAFEGSGGAAELVAEIGGQTVAYGDETAFSDSISLFLESAAMRRMKGEEACAHVDDHFAFRDYVFDLAAMLGIVLPKLSVVIPNYNYAQYIAERLNSIVEQGLPIYEIIILDDASSDNSVSKILAWMEERQIECRVIINEKNSGNAFAQWKKGAELARGEFLWIAEADDLSRPAFASHVLAPMEYDPNIVLSYCESWQINDSGQCIATSYQNYLRDMSPSHWGERFVKSGIEEVSKYLSIKNTIPNVSAVIFRRDVVNSVLKYHFNEISSLRMAGDWLTYVMTLEQGKLCFSPLPLNLHRRHGGSIIGSSKAAAAVEEVARVQELVAHRFELSEDRREQAATYLRAMKEESLRPIR